MSKPQALITAETTALARRLGIPDLTAVYITLATQGQLRSLHPDSAQFLGRTRTRERDGKLTDAEIAALDSHIPRWRTDGPAAIDAAWRDAHDGNDLGIAATRYLEAVKRGELRSTKGGPQWLANQRTKAKAGLLEPWRVRAYEAAMPGWQGATPKQLDIQAHRAAIIAEGGWNGLIDAARSGELRHFEPLLERAREAFRSGTLSGADAGALDDAAHGWPFLPGSALDEGWHAEHGTPFPDWSADFLDLVDRGQLGDHPDAQAWLIDLQRRHEQDTLSRFLTERLDYALPGWQTTPFVALGHLNRGAHGRLAESRGADSFLGQLRKQAAREMSATTRALLDRSMPGWQKTDAAHIDEGWHVRRGLPSPRWSHDWVRIAHAGNLLDHERAANAWLDQLREDHAVGLLAPGVADALAVAVPGWQDDTAAEIDADFNDARDPFTPRGMYYLALAAAGRLSTVKEAGTWLKHVRHRSLRGTGITLAQERLLSAVIPTWLTDTTATLDKARRETGLADYALADVDIRSLAMRSADGDYLGFQAALARLRAGAKADELLPSQLRLLARVLPGWQDSDALLEALTGPLLTSALDGDLDAHPQGAAWLRRQRRLCAQGMLSEETIRRYDRVIHGWRDNLPAPRAARVTSLPTRPATRTLAA